MSAEPGLVLYTSNRLERLADHLARVIAHPLGSPLVPEIVVVQSDGMRRWLEQQIAQRQSICSNVLFPFPQKLFDNLFERAFPNTSATELFGPDVLTWRIMRALAPLSARPEFAPVANYIRSDDRGLRSFQLARRIAHVFDEYVVFRPKMILDWDNGAGQEWQPVLWRELQRSAPSEHQAARALRLIEALKREDAAMPERVSIFGVSTLPPFYISMIGELSRRCPVHLFVLQPTPAWWGDIRSKRERARSSQPELFGFDEDETGDNELLAANGKLGREFLNLLAELTPAAEPEEFISPIDTSALTCSILLQIQNDIFELKSRPEPVTASLRPDGCLPKARRPVGANDRSLQIHSCHSEVRELEVLQDQLLDLFQNDPELKPKDIVVMMPDVSVYAPFIDAVFGVPENPKHKIPYSIADRPVRAASGIIDTFFRILETFPGRFTASEVLAILESDSVQRCFQIVPAEMERIRMWIDQCAIRWGIDAEHRARLGLPAFAQNSWRHGLDRMLLGCALRPGGRELFQGILPFNEIEGSSAELLGNFVEFLERLFSGAIEFRQPRSLSEWQRGLRETIDAMFAPDDAAQPELNRLRSAISKVGDIARASQNDTAVALEVVTAQLEYLLEESSSGAGFLSGQLTFCALRPMRSVPFKVICLLGLKDGAYPRHDRPPSFDLVAQRRQAGDRNIRDSDRALFLEALLSARQVFYLSYVGQSLRDNQPLPPSVLVSELLDYVLENFQTTIDNILVRHPLQAFSPRNFQPDGELFSYSAENCAAGLVSAKNRAEPPPFFAESLGQPEEEWREIELARLVEFFAHPAKFFVRHRLGIELPRDREEAEDREPFALHSLDRYAIEQRLLSDALAGVGPEGALELVRASGVLPPGGTGTLIFEELCTNVKSFAKAIGQDVAATIEPAVSIRAEINGFTLTARIDRVRGQTLVHYRLTRLKPKDFVRIWFEHLVRNLSEREPALLFGKEGDAIASYEFPPMSDATKLLADLLALYWRGLEKPLRLFPRTSWSFVEKLFSGKDKKSAHYLAAKDWKGKENDPESRGEREDPYIKLAFRNTADVLDEEWETLSRRVFEPIFSARKRR